MSYHRYTWSLACGNKSCKLMQPICLPMNLIRGKKSASKDIRGRFEEMPTIVKSRKKPYHALLLKKRQELLGSVRPEGLSASLRTPDAVEFAVKTAEQDLTAR